MALRAFSSYLQARCRLQREQSSFSSRAKIHSTGVGGGGLDLRCSCKLLVSYCFVAFHFLGLFFFTADLSILSHDRSTIESSGDESQGNAQRTEAVGFATPLPPLTCNLLQKHSTKEDVWGKQATKGNLCDLHLACFLLSLPLCSAGWPLSPHPSTNRHNIPGCQLHSNLTPFPITAPSIFGLH